MRQRATPLAYAVGGALALLALALLAAAALPQLALPYRLAQARWQARRPAHYRITVSWNDPVGAQSQLSAEVRDGRIVAVADRDCAPVPLASLGADAAMLSVDRLFEALGRRLAPAPGLLQELARYHPLIDRWLQQCATRRPDVQYDPAYGYPALIRYYSSSCEGRLAFRTDTRVRVLEFRPLP